MPPPKSPQAPPPISTLSTEATLTTVPKSVIPHGIGGGSLITGAVLVTIFITHLMACAWHYVGEDVTVTLDDGTLHTYTGWITDQFCTPDSATPDGPEGCRSVSLMEKYQTAVRGHVRQLRL